MIKFVGLQLDHAISSLHQLGFVCFLIALVEALDIVIDRCRRHDFPDPWEAHAVISSIYNWRDVARRTEAVYDKTVTARIMTDSQRMRRYLKFGRMVGPLFCLVLGLARIILWFCERAVPRHVSKNKNAPILM